MQLAMLMSETDRPFLLSGLSYEQVLGTLTLIQGNPNPNPNLALKVRRWGACNS